MHPAPSVIVFTTLSGAGFGLLAFLGAGMPHVTGWTAFGLFFVAYALAAGGLSASVFHLRRPERALKAFTQWRSSWLSREAVVSVAALLAMALFGAGLVFRATAWPALGSAGAALSLGTVLCTAMIYAQLKSVPRWRTWLTPALYLALALAGGALLAGQVRAALVLLPLAGTIQIAWWWRGDRALGQSGTTLATATGLGGMGMVRAFAPPHTGSNYLLREFAYRVGRRHALKLRVLALGLGFVLPLLILLMLPHSAHLAPALAAPSHLAGVAASRWLFFAEAEHAAALYYGRHDGLNSR